MTATPGTAAAGTSADRRGGSAVVIGGSMAGLLAARVLAGHVDRVTVVDRDELPDGAEHRRGVPQGRQFHALLGRGRTILDRLFPGYSEGLRAAGAVPLRMPGDVLLLGPFGWLDRRAAGWEMLSASRPLFEAQVRRRVRELPGVTVLERAEVTGLRAVRDGGRIRGVRVRWLDSGDEADVDADLVVDASGRGSRTPAWLAELGYPAPGRTQVDPDSAYATRVLRIPEGFAADWQAVMLTSQPPTVPRTGYLFPIEDRRWMVSLMGAAGQHPPTDEDGWRAFVRSLRDPVIADTIAGAEPTSPIRAHRGTANRQWHYERMRRRPERLLVLGDAVCAFNPIYGQGMTTAAVAAETLDACLRAHRRRHADGDLDGLATSFQRRLARRNADAWMFSTGEDLRFPTTTGVAVGHVTRLMHRYVDRISAASTRDPVVGDVYTRVIGMLDRPSALFAPRVLATAVRTTPVPYTSQPRPRPAAPTPTDAPPVGSTA